MDPSTKQRRPWADLLPEMLECIMQHLDIFSTLRLPGVCTSWVATVTRNSHLLSGEPTLLMSCPDDEVAGCYDDDKCTFMLHDVSIDKSYHAYIPAVNQRWWVGSKDGWLVTVDEYCNAELLNPLTSARIGMPSITTIPGVVELPGNHEVLQREYTSFFKRIILCEAPTHGKDYYLAIAMVTRELLAFVRAGDEHWTILTAPTGMCKEYVDAIFHKGMVFAVNRCGAIHAWDLHGANSPAQAEQVVRLPHDMEISHDFECKWNLAESNNGRLLLVCTYGSFKNLRPSRWFRQNCDTYVVEGVRLYELDLDSGRWSHVTSLGDHALFLGANYPFSVVLAAADSKGLKANCVYFTANQFLGWNCRRSFFDDPDLAIFDLGDQSYQEMMFPHSDYNFQTPIWFQAGSICRRKQACS